MKLNRLTVLIVTLIIVSVGTNIFTMLQHGHLFWPDGQSYDYDMFGNSVLLYRPAGTDSLAMINMTDAVIVVTNFGPPLNCLALTIHTPDGMLTGPCIDHPAPK